MLIFKVYLQSTKILGPHTNMLQKIYDFINTNIEISKILSKQMSFFANYRLQYGTTLAGLCDLPIGETGDRLPTHILSILLEAFKSNASDFGNGADDIGVFSADSTEVVIEGSISVLQTKRIPFSDLQLSVDKASQREMRNNVGRIRQEVIVCATLVDKVTNIAGIARTCEIFAVEKLVVSDLKVTKTDAFQGIAVSSDCWLPMSQVDIQGLVPFLRSCKSLGYTILGLEQTDSSRSLFDYSQNTIQLPSRSVLVLGKEREGIPVDILQEIDECVEIPQFGVIRSLNVHVSAALAVWELTKRNASKML